MKKIFALLLATAIAVFAFDINSASKSELMSLKGIGEKKAESIIKYRKEHGKFISGAFLFRLQKGFHPYHSELLLP
jgi:transcriptional accessory protein Tex/SPT6